METRVYDVAIVGGGPSGIAAAIAAKETGAKTLLIERTGMFGGQATSSQVAAFCGFYTRGAKPDLAVGGIGARLLAKMERYGFDTKPYPSKSTGNTNVKFDPEVMKLIFDELLLEAEVDVLLHTTLIQANVVEDEIESILCLDDEGVFEVKARQFVDASGNGNLVNAARIPTNWGDNFGLVQQASLVFKLVGLPPRDILNREIEEAIKKGKEAGIPNLVKEKGMIIKQITDTTGYCTIPSILIENLSGHTLTVAEMSLRKQVYAYTETFRRFLEGCQEIQIAQSGPQIGVREARRIIGEEELKGEDVLHAVKRNDSIGRAAWSVEIHKSNTAVEYLYIADNDYASIPLGSLKVKACENLWAAGRIIATDPVAFGSVRVMGTGLATGHAAGVAAALNSLHETVDIKQIQETLLQQGALI